MTNRSLNIANFSLSSSLNFTGKVFDLVWFNPPVEGSWLTPLCKCDLSLKIDDKFISTTELPIIEGEVIWPFPFLKFDQFSLSAFAPLAFNDITISSLPLIFLEIHANNDVMVLFSVTKHPKAIKDPRILVLNKNNVAKSNGIETGTHIIFVLSVGDDILFNYYDLKLKLADFESRFPKVEHRALLNQEVMVGIALTRVLKSGKVLTMGYCELNQRDSFWTSFVHLVLFQEAEIKMIEESCEGQLLSGKIPTTLLPFIDRAFDIDITAYFILRIVRYFRYYEDKNFALKCLPYARRAVLYLKELRDSSNIPFARDYWADWKDVPGMNQRLYGPYFVLLCKAAVKEFNWMCKELGEAPEVVVINDEPLWNGEYFVDIFRNGTTDSRFHEDQLIPALWGVISDEKYLSILRKSESFENDFGLPETIPYYPETFGYKIGEYHNGGIWPWLIFADAAGRIAAGYRESGERMFYKTIRADIELFGDYCPNEYLNGSTGENSGHFIQGWNACAFLTFSLLSDSPRNKLPEYMSNIRFPYFD